MKITSKIIKYGIVFALGYCLGSCNCNADNVRVSKLEQEVVKYEQRIGEGTGYKPVVYSRFRAGY